MNPTTMTDDELRDWLAFHNQRIASRRASHGHSSLPSDRAMISEAIDSAYPFQQEAKRRGITVSRLADILGKMSDRSLATLYRYAKTRASHWFADPKAMVILRNVCQRRGLIE